MVKQIWVIGTFSAGVILCIFGNSAFAAIGVILGLAGVAAGVCFMGGFVLKRGFNSSSLMIGIGLSALGLLLIILSIFVEAVAFFLGGIITVAAGIILLPFCGRHQRLIMPFCIGCMAVGVLMLFAPGLIGWIAVVMGIALLLYSGTILMFMW